MDKTGCLNKIMNRKSFLIVFIVFLLFFTLFSRYVKKGGLKGTDFAVTVKVQERIDKSSHLRSAELVGDVLEGSVIAGSPNVSIVVSGILTIIACIDIRRKRFRLAGLVIPVCLGLLTLTELYGKSVVHHPAPPFFMLKNPITHFPQYHIVEEFSYPSGHIARSVYISLITLFLFRNSRSIAVFRLLTVRNMGIVLSGIAYVTLVTVSVVYLGHHWLSDGIGGILIGLGFGTLAGTFLLNEYRAINGKSLAGNDLA